MTAAEAISGLGSRIDQNSKEELTTLFKEQKDMEVKITPTKKISILGLDKRSVKDIAWCAATYGMNRLYWVNGYLLCSEVYEKSIEHEIKHKEFPISHVCYGKFPKYERKYEIEKGVQIPIVDVSDMELFKKILEAILKKQKANSSEQ